MLKLDWTVIDVICKILEARGLTKREAAIRAGIRPNTLSAWRRGQQPNTQTLEALARMLSTTVVDLYRAVPQSRDALILSQVELEDVLIRNSDAPLDFERVLYIWKQTAHLPNLRKAFLDFVNAIAKDLPNRSANPFPSSTPVPTRRKALRRASR